MTGEMNVHGIMPVLEQLLRIIVASGMGFLIGFERQAREKSAGVRTHTIVALGSALMMIVSKYGFYDVAKYDAARVAAQIVSGVGFLGAGVIFVRKNSVSGLTTAAGLWATAGVGMAIGAGNYGIGICAGLLVVLIQEVMHRSRFLMAEATHGTLKIIAANGEDFIPFLKQRLETDHIKITGIKIKKKKEGTEIELDVIYAPLYDKSNLLLELASDPRVVSVEEA